MYALLRLTERYGSVVTRSFTKLASGACLVKPSVIDAAETVRYEARRRRAATSRPASPVAMSTYVDGSGMIDVEMSP